jgi:hypothetical protein
MVDCLFRSNIKKINGYLCDAVVGCYWLLNQYSKVEFDNKNIFKGLVKMTDNLYLFLAANGVQDENAFGMVKE